MANKRISLGGLQVVVCLIGLGAGFVPGISFTGRFWGLSLSQGSFGPDLPEDASVRVIDVERGSPADRAGFRVGDAIKNPRTIDDVRKAEGRMKRGAKQVFHVRRDEHELVIESNGFAPDLAAVWYAHPWYPIAGMLFLCIGVFAFATEPSQPAPLWRSIPLIVAGLGIAVGFGLALLGGSVFSRWRIYQVWPMGTGEEWDFRQGLIGMTAGAALATLAAAEVRQRLSKALPPAASLDRVQR
jgi:hypothetical protein